MDCCAAQQKTSSLRHMCGLLLLGAVMICISSDHHPVPMSGLLVAVVYIKNPTSAQVVQKSAVVNHLLTHLMYRQTSHAHVSHTSPSPPCTNDNNRCFMHLNTSPHTQARTLAVKSQADRDQTIQGDTQLDKLPTVPIYRPSQACQRERVLVRTALKYQE